MIVLVFILGMAVFSGICAYLAFQDNIAEKYTLKEREEGLIMTALKGSIVNQEFEVSEAMLNTYINDKLCKDNDGTNTGIDHIMLELNDDGVVRVYSHVFYKGQPFALQCKAMFDLDSSTSEVKAKIYEAKLGELSVPDNILNVVLSDVLENNKHIKYINNGGNNISFIASHTVEIPNTNGITLSLKGGSFKDGAVVFRTNDLKGEALSAAIEFLSSDEVKEKVSGIVDDIKDKIGGLLG